MPITIAPLGPGTTIGPGLFLQATSSLIGPLPTGTTWQLNLYADSDLTQGFYGGRITSQANPATFQILTRSSEFEGGQALNIPNDHPVYAHVDLTAGGSTDSGTSSPIPWDTTTGLGQQAWGLSFLAGGGLSSTEQAQLQQAATQTNQLLGLDTSYAGDTIATVQQVVGNIFDGISATIQGAGGAVVQTLGTLFSGKTMDLLTTFDLGTVCAPNTLDALITGGTLFGVQATCTSFADWYVFTGPGDTYSTQSLGTLTFTRGGVTILRLGLHQLNHEVYPVPGVPNTWVTFDLPTVPGDYHVILVPAPETCWNVKALRLP